MAANLIHVEENIDSTHLLKIATPTSFTLVGNSSCMLIMPTFNDSPFTAIHGEEILAEKWRDQNESNSRGHLVHLQFGKWWHLSSLENNVGQF